MATTGVTAGVGKKSFPPIKREYPEPPPLYTRSQKYGFLCEVESEFLSQQNVGEDTMWNLLSKNMWYTFSDKTCPIDHVTNLKLFDNLQQIWKMFTYDLCFLDSSPLKPPEVVWWAPCKAKKTYYWSYLNEN